MKTHELSLCRSGFCDVLSMLRADAKAMLAEDARRQFPNRTSDRWHSRFVRMLTGEHDGNNNMFSSSWGGRNIRMNPRTWVRRVHYPSLTAIE
jgi:hypothetical protein